MGLVWYISWLTVTSLYGYCYCHGREMASGNIPTAHCTDSLVLCYKGANQRPYPDINTLYSSWHQKHADNGKTTAETPSLPVTLLVCGALSLGQVVAESKGAQIQVTRNTPLNIHKYYCIPQCRGPASTTLLSHSHKGHDQAV